MILQEKDLKTVGNKVCRQGGAEVWNQAKRQVEIQVIKRVETQVMIRASWYEVWWQTKSKTNKL